MGQANGCIGAYGLYEYLYATVRSAVQAHYQAIQEPELTVLHGRGAFPGGAVQRLKHPG